MSYDNTNKGVLFKNKKKETDKHPDYNGSINIDGTDYWLSAWINEAQDGSKYMSLSKGEAKDKQSGNAGGGSQGIDDDDMDIPF